MFGGIAMNNFAWETFGDQSAHLGLTFTRLPGGTYSEVGTVVNDQIVQSGAITYSQLSGDRAQSIAYDLTFPELMNPRVLARDDANGGRNDVGTLSDAMRDAVDTNSAVSVILPTKRYTEGLDLTNEATFRSAMALAARDVDIFLTRLRDGAFNGGDLPPKIILEIGNEDYGNPIEYALIARVFISKIEQILGTSSVPFEIAFQMNNGSVMFQQLMDRNYFDQYFDSNGKAKIPALAGITFDADAITSFADRKLAIDGLMQDILGSSARHIDMLRHHFLALDAACRDGQFPCVSVLHLVRH
jgi:hypothetical protein